MSVEVEGVISFERGGLKNPALDVDGRLTLLFPGTEETLVLYTNRRAEISLTFNIDLS